MTISLMTQFGILGTIIYILHIYSIWSLFEKINFHLNNRFTLIHLILTYVIVLLFTFYLLIFSIFIFGERFLFIKIIYPIILYIPIVLLVFDKIFKKNKIKKEPLWFFSYSLLFLFLLFSFCFTNDALVLAGGRFFEGYLASDNTLPWIFTKGLIVQENFDFPSPLFADWLPSDRPPLYAAILMVPMAMFFGSNPLEGNYEILVPIFVSVSTIINCFVFFPITQFLRKYLSIKNTSIVLLSISTMPFFLVNITFSWPKIFASIFILYAIIFVLEKKWNLVWICSTLAFLSHGGTIYFSFAIGLLFFFPLLRNYKWLLVSVFFVIPWMIFQGIVIPPGDRLIKYHWAGMYAINDLNIFEAVLKAYSIDLIQIFNNKLNNIINLFYSPNKGIEWYVFMPILSSIANFILISLLLIILSNKNNLDFLNFKNLSFFGLIKKDSKICFKVIFVSIIIGVIMQFGEDKSVLSSSTTTIGVHILLCCSLAVNIKKDVYFWILLIFSIIWTTFTINITGSGKDFQFNYDSLIFLILSLFTFYFSPKLTK